MTSLLEQCLIVDDFNRDLDRSLESYIERNKATDESQVALRDCNKDIT